VQCAQNLLFVADVAVRHERHQAKTSFVMREVQSRFDPFDHLSSAASAESRQIVQTTLDVLFRRQDRFGSQLRRVIGKPNDLKRVTRSQRLQSMTDGRLSLGC
jgi:hypothetical protein